MKKTAYLSLVLTTSLFASIATQDSYIRSWRSLLQENNPDKNIYQIMPRSVEDERQKGVDYINKLRVEAGMIPFKRNSLLDKASQNHSNYLSNLGYISHGENPSNNGFTGSGPGDRINYVGYAFTAYSENISGGYESVEESIDGLFSAIYHRFGFLNFNVNEIGIGKGNRNWVYNMGSLIYNVVDQNPDYVLWPPKNYQQMQRIFDNAESPAPLNCTMGGISGNPISIAFKNRVNMQSFKLYKNNVEITDTTIKSPMNDGNLDNEFVLFPTKQLLPDTKYTAKFVYDNAKTIEWSFKTRGFNGKYFFVKNNQTIKLKPNEEYYVLLDVDDCNLNLYGSYIPQGQHYSLEFVGPAVLKVRTRGLVGGTDVIKVANSKFQINIQIANEDEAIDNKEDPIISPEPKEPTVIPIQNAPDAIGAKMEF